MDADGSNPTNLTNSPGLNLYPSFSPDGTKIAFASYRDGNAEIYVMDAADGSNQIRLTNNSEDDLVPDFSPDGTKIAFTSFRDGNAEIYVMNAADGSNQIRLTNNSGDNLSPSWGVSPDTDGDGVIDDDDVCPGTVLPEDQPTRGLKKNRFIANGDGDFVDGNGTLAGISVADTGGCSGSQIITAAGLGNGHSKFGISRSALLDWIATLP
jgi:TolB protein